MTFEAEITSTAEGRISKYAIYEDGQELSYGTAIQHWHLSGEFCAFYIGWLADSPFVAFRWETPAVTCATTERQFEFVLLDYPRLERRFDASTFNQYFDDSDVVSFPNLRGDASLVVPCPRSEVEDQAMYAHLAAFVRLAPIDQVHAFWKAVGTAMERRLSDRRLAECPVWLSTAGMGVAWLHVRLDLHPKYYAHTPYKEKP